jgi:hypothetical protein
MEMARSSYNLGILTNATDVRYEGVPEFPASLKSLGITVDSRGILHEPGGRDMRCYSCNTPITGLNIGNIMPGRYYVFCKREACLSEYFQLFG